MTDVLVCWPDYRKNTATGDARRWHFNHRVFDDWLLGDRLWVVTSGKSLAPENESSGYLLAVWPVAEVVKNPGDDPQYPARKYQHRVLANEAEAIHLPLWRWPSMDSILPHVSVRVELGFSATRLS